LVQDGQAQLAIPLSIVPGAAYTSVVAPVMEQIAFNTSRFPFDDVKVRQAARYALDAAEIISDPLTGAATAALVIDPVSALYGADSAVLRPTFDPVRARALLAEAGYNCATVPCARTITRDDGAVVSQTLQFTLVTTERNPRNAISQVIQKQLSAAGFAVDIQILHGLGTNSRLFAPFEQGGILLTRDFDAALYQAPSLSRLSSVFDCASIPSAQNPAPTQGNVFGLCDGAVDALIANAEGGEATASTAGRAKGYADALQAIADSAVFAPLYSPLWALSAQDVSGVRFNGSGVMTWNAWEWVQMAQR
jgi:ABC-type transport system substrate-binding protein